MTQPIELLGGLATTRAIRRYTKDPIPEEDLAKIMFAASRAPSGSNRQTFRFVTLRTSPVSIEAKALLGNAFRASWADKSAADGYEAGSGSDDDSPKSRMARSMQQFVNNFEATPVVVLACVQHRHLNLLDGASIYPACQNLLLAARALGYGGVLTAWHGLVEEELRALLQIPSGYAIAATIPLGVPEGRHGPVRRRPLRELVFDGHWGAEAAWANDPAGTRFISSGPPRAQSPKS